MHVATLEAFAWHGQILSWSRLRETDPIDVFLSTIWKISFEDNLPFLNTSIATQPGFKTRQNATVADGHENGQAVKPVFALVYSPNSIPSKNIDIEGYTHNFCPC